MAKSLFTKEIKDYILSEIARHDLVSVDDIAKIIYDLHIYNAETAEFQWCRDKAKRLMGLMERQGRYSGFICRRPSKRQIHQY